MSLPTPFYDEGGITIYCGDCREIVHGIQGIDAVISDPPYGMEWESNQRFSGGNTRRGLGTKHAPIAGDSAEFDPSHILALRVPTVLWGANHFWHRLPAGAALVWQKRNENALGTFLSDAEIAFMNVGCGVYICRKVFAGSLRAVDSGGTAYAGSAHPNQKPVMLMGWCMERAKIPTGATILDPYMGSGTTLIAAKLRGLRAVGIEINKDYCEAAVARLSQGVLLPC